MIKAVGADRKPNSVPGFRLPLKPGDDHSSRTPVARRLPRPTRKLGRDALIRFPIWSCTWRGLQSFSGRPENWWALTPPFHPYRALPQRSALAVYFLLHFPSRRRDSALRSAIPCGVRTFLQHDVAGDRLVCSDRFYFSCSSSDGFFQ